MENPMCFDFGFHWSSPAKPVLHSGRSQHAAWSIWGATGSRAPVEDFRRSSIEIKIGWKQGDRNKWVCLKIWKWLVPLNPMVLLIIIPMKNGYFIGNIPYFQTNPNEGTNIERKHVSHYVSFHFMRMEWLDGSGNIGGDLDLKSPWSSVLQNYWNDLGPKAWDDWRYLSLKTHAAGKHVRSSKMSDMPLSMGREVPAKLHGGPQVKIIRLFL